MIDSQPGDIALGAARALVDAIREPGADYTAAVRAFLATPGVAEDLEYLGERKGWRELSAELRLVPIVWRALSPLVRPRRTPEDRAARIEIQIERAIAPAAIGEGPVVSMMQRGRPGRDGEAQLSRNPFNLGIILTHDSRWRGRIRFNEFRSDEEILDCGRWRGLTDVDAIKVQRWVSAEYRLDYQTATVHEQLIGVAHEHRAHPVRNYLQALLWDGTKRMDSWLGDVFGVDATLGAHLVGRAWLISMVARIMSPGCKVDTVPILIGRQGLRKSTTLRAMMPDATWFSDSDIPLHHSQDKYQVIQGVWLYEIAEFDRFTSKSDAAEVKAYVSSQRDTFRRSHGRRVASVDRQVVFAGSTNAAEFLVDPTGSRRYWPLVCSQADPDVMHRIRDQLWAEAVAAYEAGESWWLSSEVAAEVAEMADAFRVGDPWDEPLSAWLAEKTATARLSGLIMADILADACGTPIGVATKREQGRAGAIMVRLGWTKKKRKHDVRWYPPVGGHL
jgi:putative DNA primase/helicase